MNVTRRLKPDNKNRFYSFLLSLVVFLLFGFLSACTEQANWDKQRMQWRNELNTMTEKDLPGLEKQMLTGDPRAIFISFALTNEKTWKVHPSIDINQLNENIKTLAEQGHPILMDILALQYNFGKQGLPVNEELAVFWYRKSAELGYGKGMYDLAYMYEQGKGGLAKDQKQAADWYRKAALAGSAAGMQKLGFNYENGIGGLPKDETQATDWYQKAAMAGDAEAMYKLGEIYEYGNSILARNDIQAESWFRKAAEAGSASAMNGIGYFFETGRGGLAKDDKQAFEWYLKSANSGSSQGMFNVGVMYQNGVGIPKDTFKAFNWYISAAHAGNAIAMFNFGKIYEEGLYGFNKDDALALDWYKKAVNAGSSAAMVKLGYMYEMGSKQLKKDEIQAVSWYQKSADAGNTAGMYLLGTLFLDGKDGLPKDEAQAVAWFQKAATAGHAESMVFLGTMYEEGKKPFDKNESQAITWYRKAAESGNKTGMYNLGLMYLRGKGGLSKDKTQAVTWFRKAAEAGSVIAMTYLGGLYQGQDGFAENQSEAAKWYNKAADKGNPTAMVNLGTMYHLGLGGLTKNEENAAKWFLKSAEAGNELAMQKIASYYLDGTGGMVKDPLKALAWLRKAINAGNTIAELTLAEWYRKGKAGLTKNQQPIQLFYRKVADKGYSVGMAMTGGLYLRNSKSTTAYTRGTKYLLEAFKIDRPKPTNISNSEMLFINHRDYSFLGSLEAISKDANSLIKKMLEDTIVNKKINDPALIKQVHALAKIAPELAWAAAPKTLANGKTVFSVKAKDIGGGIGDIKLFVDDHLVNSEVRDTPVVFASTPHPQKPSEQSAEFSVDLPPGKHKIKLTAYNADNVINFSTVSTTVSATKAVRREPRLFALVLGIDEYANKDFNLKNAQNDAEAVEKTLNEQEGKLYKSVKVTYLHGTANTTKESILNAFKAINQDTNHPEYYNDVFVFYVAGHGKNINGTYYLYSSDVKQSTEQDIRNASIDQHQLQRLLSTIGISKKLVIVDTCDSGDIFSADSIISLDDDKQTAEQINQDRGAAVLMATQKDGDASDEYKEHGLFTYALLQGLKGQAANNNGIVTANTLADYVTDKVKEISVKEKYHQQSPVSSIKSSFDVVSGVKPCKGECQL